MTARPSRDRATTALIVAGAGALALALLLARSLTAPLDHDEHQFIASGALVADSLLPYRDFPYFHVPNLAFVNAALFAATDHLLLAARSFSVLCGWLTLALVFAVGWRAAHRFQGRVWFATACALLLLCSPLFMRTSVLSWNHALPTLLALGAFLVHLRALRSGGMAWALLSGLLVGLATGTRLSFAPLFLPFGIMLALRPLAMGRRLALVAGFAAGGALGLAPTLALFYLAPDDFLFGNFGYARLNTAYREDLGWTRAMTLPGKVGYLLEVMAKPGNLIPLLLAAVALPLTRARRAAAGDRLLALSFLLLLFPFLLLGAFAPTPSWPQYHYVLLPFLALAIAMGLPHLTDTARRERAVGVLLAAALLQLPFTAARAELPGLLEPETWTGVELHSLGEAAARAGGEDLTVLTLAPIVPLEGEQQIHRELATGPFGWRTGYLLDAAERAERQVLTGADVTEPRRAAGVRAVLLGVEPKDEADLRRLVRVGRFRAIPLDSGVVLHVSLDPAVRHLEAPRPGAGSSGRAAGTARRQPQPYP